MTTYTQRTSISTGYEEEGRTGVTELYKWSTADMTWGNADFSRQNAIKGVPGTNYTQRPDITTNYS